MSLAAAVEQLTFACLFSQNEVKPGEKPLGAVEVEGVVQRFGFHPAKLKYHRKRIIELLNFMPPSFHKGSGEGDSFLNLTKTKNGEKWGSQRHAEQLVCLAMGIGCGGWMLPKSQWYLFARETPYVIFDTREKEIIT